MKKELIIAVLFTCFYPATGYSKIDQSTKKIYDHCQGQNLGCINYFVGAYDGYLAGARNADDKSYEFIIHCMGKHSPNDLAKSFVDLIDKNPEMLNLPSGIVVYQASQSLFANCQEKSLND